MSKYNFDPLAIQGGGQPEKEEGILLADAVANVTMDRMAFSTTYAMANAIAGVEPDSEATIHDVVFDSVGEDPEALAYGVGMVLDLAENLGMSQVAMDDLFSEDQDIAMDEMQNFASLLNGVTTDDIDLATVVSVSLDSMEIAEEFEEGVTLDSVTFDWMFSKKKPKKLPKTVGKHRMKTVACHRTINGKSQSGFCRYPTSLLKGKAYVKSGVSSAQRSHLAEMVTDAHTARSEKRRAKNIKLTAAGHKGSKSAGRD